MGRVRVDFERALATDLSFLRLTELFRHFRSEPALAAGSETAGVRKTPRYRGAANVAVR